MLRKKEKKKLTNKLIFSRDGDAIMPSSDHTRVSCVPLNQALLIFTSGIIFGGFIIIIIFYFKKKKTMFVNESGSWEIADKV